MSTTKDGTPEGFERLAGYSDDAQRLHAYRKGDHVVVCGIPFPTDDEEAAHNCDQMGCLSDHVIARFRLAATPAPQGATQEGEG